MLEGLRLIPLSDSIPWKIFMVIKGSRKEEPGLWELAKLFL